MTPFGRSRDKDQDAARQAANGHGESSSPPSPPPAETAPPPPSPSFPAPSPAREEPAAADAGPWGPVGGEPSKSTPPHGTPRPAFASESPRLGSRPASPLEGVPGPLGTTPSGPRSAPATPPGTDTAPLGIPKPRPLGAPPPPRADYESQPVTAAARGPLGAPDPVAEPEPEPEPEQVAPASAPPAEPPPPAADASEPGEPTFRGPLESALRHPFLAIVPVVALVAIAAVIGATRDPTYTAESRVSVGRVDVPAYTLQGVIIGNATLASGYARTIDAEPVAGPAGNAVGLTPSEARDRLSASPIPETTLIRVEAEGPNQSDAVKLANAGSRSLINYVEDLNRQQEGSGLLRRFRAARAKAERARTTLERLERNPNVRTTRLEKARLDLAAAQLEADTIGNQYRALQGGPEAQNLLQFVAPAAEASSDRRSMFQRLILIGLAAGILVGLALALLRENSHLIGRKST